MTGQHRFIDHVFLAVLLIFPLVELRWTWPRYLARLKAGEPNARLNFYRAIMLGEWTGVLILLATWAALGRPLAVLMLIPASLTRFIAGMAVVLTLVGLLAMQNQAIRKRPEVLPKVRRKMAQAEALIPHTCVEQWRFRAVSITAGACEELLFRGFLLWYFAVWVGVWPAAILSSLVFGLGHVYLGVKQIPNTALVGMIMAVIVILSGSLWPAMLLHAAIDWNSGEIGYFALKADVEN